MKRIKKSRLLKSFNIAITGIFSTIKSERNMKIHIITALLVLVLSFFFKLTQSEFLFIALAVALVFITEILNTSIEKLGDAITKEHNEIIKIAKDISSGAVLVASLFAILVGIVVFHKEAQSEMEVFISILSRSPLYLMLLALSITVIAVIVIKKITNKGTHLKGGFPSGHSALAFCVATGIAIISKNIYVAILSLLIASMVAESRIETKVHSFLEVIFGALLGISIALVVFKLVEVFI
ncbi:MAG: diacylglycerol kinase [Clostridiales bacterium]|nr:diacylglycerol kinase [Clostridiales bacterium]